MVQPDPESATAFGPRHVLLRYWGSHFKHSRHGSYFAAELRPLVARGWRCCLVLEPPPPEDPSWLGELEELGITVALEPRPRGNFDARCVIRVRSLSQRVGATLFHCDNLHTSPLIGAALAKVPVRVWSKRAMDPHFEESRPRTLRERMALSTRVSCALATRVLAVSAAVKRQLVSLGVDERKVLVRHNPRRLGVVHVKEDRDVTRGNWGFRHDDVVVVTVGHAVPVKGWDILLQGFARVVCVNDRARLLLVGSYQAQHERSCHLGLQRLIQSLNLSGKVHFAGHLVDVAPALAAADVYVSPSRSEGFSFALVEALEAGLPAVATRVGIAEEVIDDSRSGFLVERCDVEALARSLIKLVQDDALRRQFAARARVPDLIPTLESYAERLACDYEALLAEVEGSRRE